MKKWFIYILFVFIVFIILFPKQMGYDGGFTGGDRFFENCLGFSFLKIPETRRMPDGVNSAQYCVGIPYNKVK